MPGLSALSFGAPWVLVLLAALPAVWWLLRITPPAAKRITFPAVSFLLNLKTTEESSARSPWWLTALRMITAALLILAVAGPRLSDTAPPPASPLVLVIDNSWAAAPEWAGRLDAARSLVERRAREDQPVALVLTAPEPGSDVPFAKLMSAPDALARLDQSEPQPWRSDRAAAARAITALPVTASADAVWVADGIATSGDDTFAEALGRFKSVTRLATPAASLVAIDQPEWITEDTGPSLIVPVRRLGSTPVQTLSVQLRNAAGQVVMAEDVQFEETQREAKPSLEVPAPLAGDIAQVSVKNSAGAAARYLMDGAGKYRAVGLVSGIPNQVEAPLLQDLYYVDRALQPTATLFRGSISDVLDLNVSAIVLASVGRLAGGDEQRLRDWTEAGGTLIRFAGPTMAEGADGLVPVPLRRGGRALGGTLSWTDPQRLAPFPEGSPFEGLPAPQDATVTSQVLADPNPGLEERTWATLQDGTPLVTGRSLGQGWLVLFHVTANADWSDLPLSGVFVDMLDRVIKLSDGGPVALAPSTVLQPDTLVDGFGRLVPPHKFALPLSAADLRAARPSPLAPPGRYTDGSISAALNLGPDVFSAASLPDQMDGVAEQTLSAARNGTDLTGPVLAIVLALLMADSLISLMLRGALPRFGRAGASAAVAFFAIVVGATPNADAQDTGALSEKSIAAALETRLAYVNTPDAALNRRAALGLTSLTAVLADRTSAELGPPAAVNPAVDELSVYPLVYWLVPDDATPPDDAAAAALNAYMRKGGMILFDGAGQSADGAVSMRSVLERLEIPPLMRAPSDHVISRSFYLLPNYAGRTVGAPVWVARPSETNDGVSSVIIGSNDWAGAWARDASFRPLYPVIPGGERQREMAYRFGVNVVMYALTGNYKGDQVHLPAIMERLTQ